MGLSKVPAPEPDETSMAFFDGLEAGVLLVQRCTACGTCDLGRLYCGECGAEALAWRPASGRGRVHSFVVMRMAYDPALADQIPYLAGVVELEEGPRLFAQIAGTDAVEVGQPVELELLRLADGAVVPGFRPYG
jgi:uncharacterized OB-fold protein